jgi:hypothetical protein
MSSCLELWKQRQQQYPLTIRSRRDVDTSELPTSHVEAIHAVAKQAAREGVEEALAAGGFGDMMKKFGGGLLNQAKNAGMGLALNAMQSGKMPSMSDLKSVAMEGAMNAVGEAMNSAGDFELTDDAQPPTHVAVPIDTTPLSNGASQRSARNLAVARASRFLPRNFKVMRRKHFAIVPQRQTLSLPGAEGVPLYLGEPSDDRQIDASIARAFGMF